MTLRVAQLDGFMTYPKPYASFCFTGAGQDLRRVLPGAGNALNWTCSFWTKPVTDNLTHTHFASSAMVNNNNVTRLLELPSNIALFQTTDGAAAVTHEAASSAGVYIDNGTWNHYVWRYDSPNGTGANRLLLYVNGVNSVIPVAAAIALNEIHQFFRVGNTIQIGQQIAVQPFLGKMAFINVVDGLSLLPSDFGLSVGGVWTRKGYPGHHGTFGFQLNGETDNGFALDTGPGGTNNHMNITGPITLDHMDLPPYQL